MSAVNRSTPGLRALIALGGKEPGDDDDPIEAYDDDNGGKCRDRGSSDESDSLAIRPPVRHKKPPQRFADRSVAP